MEEMMSNKEKRRQVQRLSYYYRHPEKISYDEKALLNEAKAKNPDIHFKALQINKTIWLKEKKVTVK